MTRHALARMAVCWAATACLSNALAQSVDSPDLSLLSDFGRPDIPFAVLGVMPSGGNIAAISQTGNRGTASIEQSGSTSNAEVWQQGQDDAARVFQQGSGQVLRLSQVGDAESAFLTQQGVDNRMAIIQVGGMNGVQGLQQGTDNQLVLRQHGDSQFSFSQIGNSNQISADLPSGVAMRVEQAGDSLRTQITPMSSR